MRDLRDMLNPSQLETVNTVHGPLLVIAGAGSGKTRTIEYRVLSLVRSGVKPESILLLTFTKKAAHEMLSRATRNDARCKNVDGGTFHSFAFRTLKKYAKALGISPQFSILDEGDAEDAVHKCGARLNIFENEKKVPKKGTLRSIISMSVNKGIPVSHILEKEYPHFAHLSDDIERLRKEYAAYKINKNYMDYDDLLVYLKLLLEIKEIREKISSKYQFVMVDEYQDTNRLQGDIAYLLAEGHKNIMAVGDDAQSIYGFRGASHENIMAFPKKFDNCRIIKLEENYRSTQSILDVANTLLGNMRNKYSKCLHSTRPEPGDMPSLSFFKDVYEEAAWITDRIKSLQGQGVELEHQSVLFRSAYLSIPLQAELNKEGIPYQVFGGLKFYETAHVKDIISHLKIILNPKDEIAWHRVLTLVDGIGPKTADVLADEAMSKSSLEAISEEVFAGRERRCSDKISKGLKRLRRFIANAAACKLNPGLMYGAAFDYYLPLFRDKFDDWHVRANDLEAMRQISERYEILADLLADFAIEPPEHGVWGVDPKA
ncbi:MAG: ATP-dependent helicase, partial [Spirochaetales bacterium]